MSEPYPFIADDRDKQDRHETPSGTGYDPFPIKGRTASLKDTTTLWDAHRPPENQFQAVMEARPGVEPVDDMSMWDTSRMDEALDTLDDREKAVIELVVMGGMSLRDAGMWLARNDSRGRAFSKDTVANIRNRAFVKLRAFYEGNG